MLMERRGRSSTLEMWWWIIRSLGTLLAMRRADLTSIEIADLLSQMYTADHGGQDDAPSRQQRTELADYLGCHEEARASAWEAWAAE